ncbi:MAG: hypothetical protein P9L99_07900 [Candidatus Lernaella stagnicola]|nr:hypothetical protein [Candidatus Lernaella stagnicola]
MSEEHPRATLVRDDDQNRVDQTVRWLHEQKDAMEAELTMRAKIIGDYLIREFFDDNIAEVSSQNPTKNVSFKNLCEREDLPFSEAALRRFIHVAVNFRVLPSKTARELPPSHHSVLYQVANPDERCRIGGEVVENSISVRELRKMVKGKGRRRPGGGRKPTSDFYKEWKLLVAAMEKLEQDAAEGGFLEPERRNEVFQESRRVRDKLNRLMDRLMDLPRQDEDDS